jgi:hypothetical protein
METATEVAAVIRNVLDTKGYATLRRVTRVSNAALHRLADPATVGLAAFFRVQRVYAAALEQIAPARKPKPKPPTSHFTGRKPRRRPSRKAA